MDEQKVTKVSLTGPNAGSLHAVESDPCVAAAIADGMHIYRRWTFGVDTHFMYADSGIGSYDNVDERG